MPHFLSSGKPNSPTTYRCLGGWPDKIASNYSLYDFDGSSKHGIQNDKYLATSCLDRYAEEACLCPLKSKEGQPNTLSSLCLIRVCHIKASQLLMSFGQAKWLSQAQIHRIATTQCSLVPIGLLLKNMHIAKNLAFYLKWSIPLQLKLPRKYGSMNVELRKPSNSCSIRLNFVD